MEEKPEPLTDELLDELDQFLYPEDNFDFEERLPHDDEENEEDNG